MFYVLTIKNMGTLFYKSWLGWLSPDFLGILTHNRNPGITQGFEHFLHGKIKQNQHDFWTGKIGSIYTHNIMYIYCMYVYIYIYDYLCLCTLWIQMLPKSISCCCVAMQRGEFSCKFISNLKNRYYRNREWLVYGDKQSAGLFTLW